MGQSDHPSLGYSVLPIMLRLVLAPGQELLFSSNHVRASGKGTWMWKGRRWRSAIKVDMKSEKDKYSHVCYRDDTHYQSCLIQR